MTDNGNTAGASPNVSPVANMHDFARFITQGAEAIAKVPELESQIGFIQRDLGEAQRHSQELELTLRDRNDTIDGLRRQLAEVERERDTFRHSAADAASQRDRLVQSFEAAMGMVQDDIRQVVPQPEPEAAPSPTPGPTQRSSGSSDHNPELASSSPVASPPTTPYPVADPTPPAKPQPYAGRKYYEVPHYVHLSDWLDGGGTEADYNAKRNTW